MNPNNKKDRSTLKIEDLDRQQATYKHSSQLHCRRTLHCMRRLGQRRRDSCPCTSNSSTHSCCRSRTGSCRLQPAPIDMNEERTPRRTSETHSPVHVAEVGLAKKPDAHTQVFGAVPLRTAFDLHVVHPEAPPAEHVAHVESQAAQTRFERTLFTACQCSSGWTNLWRMCVVAIGASAI